jgi:hypothetical protein
VSNPAERCELRRGGDQKSFSVFAILRNRHFLVIQFIVAAMD